MATQSAKIVLLQKISQMKRRIDMQLSEIIRRAEKELATATRNLETAKRRSAPEQDVRNLEAKVEYRKAVLEILTNELD